MDDLKELLPLAARACGYTWVYGESPGGGLWWHADPDTAREWNPFTPGDGAEMEDKLRIEILRSGGEVIARRKAVIEWAVEYVADHPDEGTARRWASLRVAAAIGRSMK